MIAGVAECKWLGRIHLWKKAVSCGATCARSWSQVITHVVIFGHPARVSSLPSLLDTCGLFVVSSNWLAQSLASSRREYELLYSVPYPGTGSTAASATEADRNELALLHDDLSEAEVLLCVSHRNYVEECARARKMAEEATLEHGGCTSAARRGGPGDDAADDVDEYEKMMTTVLEKSPARYAPFVGSNGGR